jgi:hypothetical protein
VDVADGELKVDVVLVELIVHEDLVDVGALLLGAVTQERAPSSENPTKIPFTD